MGFWAGFLIGMFIGAGAGVFLMAMCVAAGNESRAREKEDII